MDVEMLRLQNYYFQYQQGHLSEKILGQYWLTFG